MALFVVLVRLAFAAVFGNRSLDSLSSSALAGINLALWILGFGAINLLVDFRKLFSRSPKFLGNFITALKLTFSLTPELARGMIRIRTAARLRSTRKGFRQVASTIVPMLSDAIDQSLNLADSMEARGFGGRLTTAQGAIKLSNVYFSYSPDQPILNDLDFEAPAGTITLITGATGCGKSTLLKVIQAKVPGVGFVGQFPRQTFVAETVFDELAFALRQSKLSESEIRSRVTEIAKSFDLELSAKPLELSAGWQQRVAIAAALSSGTKILLLDEPFSALDSKATQLVLETLSRLKGEGYTIVIAEHRTLPLQKLADQTLKLENGKLNTHDIRDRKLKVAKSRTNVTALVGENGSGKTTYLNKLATTQGVLVPQPARDLLFLDTVAAECTQADRDNSLAPGATFENLRRLNTRITELQNPRDLSEGEKLSLSIAIQLSKETDLLMLDEPTLGFDFDTRQNLVTLISELSERGIRVLVATHDQEFANSVASEVMSLATE